MLVQALPRLNKFLVPDYLEEFASALRHHVVDKVVLKEGHPQDIPRDQLTYTEALRQLYGSSVLPDDLLSFFNLGINRFEHLAAAYELLYKHVMKVQDKPVVTRFWLFGDALFSLLRFKLLNLPDSIFMVSLRNPRPECQNSQTVFGRC